jgi:hypothetical protein
MPRRDRVVRGGVVFGDIAVTRDLCGDAINETGRTGEARRTTQPRLHERDVAVVGVDAVCRLALSGESYRRLQATAHLVAEHMPIEALDERQDDAEKLAPVLRAS